MAFGSNRVELIGRLGADVTVNQLMSGGRVANRTADAAVVAGIGPCGPWCRSRRSKRRAAAWVRAGGEARRRAAASRRGDGNPGDRGGDRPNCRKSACNRRLGTAPLWPQRETPNLIAAAVQKVLARHVRPCRHRPLPAGPARPRADADLSRPEPGRGARHRSVDQAGRLHRDRVRRQQGAPARVPLRRGPRQGRRHGAGYRRGAVEPGAHRGRAQTRDGSPHPARGPGRGRQRDLPHLRQPAARPGARRNPARFPRGRGRGGGGCGDGAPRGDARGRGPQALRHPLRAGACGARRARLRARRRRDRGAGRRHRLRRRGLRLGQGIKARAIQARAGEAVIGIFGLQPCPSWATRSRNNASCEPMVPSASYASVESLADTQWSLKSALPCLPGRSLLQSSLFSVVSGSRRGR